MSEIESPRGFHFVLDCFECDSLILDSMNKVESRLKSIAQEVGASVVDSCFKSFGSGHGFTGALILSESHVTIHTWPREKFAAVDFFTCGELLDPARARGPIEELLQSRTSESSLIRRGEPAGDRDRRPRAHGGAWASEGDGILALSLRHQGKTFHGHDQERLSLEVIENPYFGKVILHGGQILLTEKDYRNFSETQIHPLFFVGRKISRVLILGGGDGTLLKETLRHREVKSVTVVDRDPGVSEICKKEFPELRKAFADRRVRLLTGDAAQSLDTLKDECFDLILVDFTPAQDLGGNFYRTTTLAKLKDLLTRPGFLVVQAGNLREVETAGKALRKILAASFGRSSRSDADFIHPLQFSLPSTATGAWVSLVLSSQKFHPSRDFQTARCCTWLKKNRCEILDEDYGRAVFAPSRVVKDIFQ
jgi:spermidine synthase